MDHARHDGATGAAITSRVRLGTLMVLAAVVLQTAGHMIFILTDSADRFDVNSEGGFAAAVSAVVLLVTARGVMLLASDAERPRADRALAAILVFLAVDEVLAIHERVGVVTARVLGLSDAWDSVLWPVMYMPLLGLVFVLLWVLASTLPTPARRALRSGLALLISAVVLEVASAPFSTPTTARGLAHAYEGMIEEALELGGWGLIATGVVSAGLAVRRAAQPLH